jgi:hypothetical protein
VTVCAEAVGQGSRIDTLNRLLACGIHRRDEHHVRVVERALELLHQRLKAGVSVRLHHRDHAALGTFASRCQHRANLGRMVGIIVDDRRAVSLTDLREAALDTFEPFEPGNDCFVGNPEFQRDSDRRQRVLDIVPARNGNVHVDRAAFAILVEDQSIEFGATGNRRDAVRPHIG